MDSKVCQYKDSCVVMYQSLRRPYTAPVLTELVIPVTQGGQAAPLESSAGFLS
jgi:hypothetical protein